MLDIKLIRDNPESVKNKHHVAYSEKKRQGFSSKKTQTAKEGAAA